MLCLQHQLTTSQQRQLENNTLTVKMRKFAGFTSFRCLPQLARLADTLKRHQHEGICEYPMKLSHTVAFACPQGHMKKSTFFTLLALTTKSMWCKQCARSFASTKWKCSCGEFWHQCRLHFSVPIPAAREAWRDAPPLRESSHSMSILATLDIKPTHHTKLCFQPGPKLMARFSHLVAQPQATPLVPGNGTHPADAGWLAAAGFAAADAATENAADISIHVNCRRDGSPDGPDHPDREAPAPVSEPPVLSNRGQMAPEQPGRSAKTRSRPFRIPR